MTDEKKAPAKVKIRRVEDGVGSEVSFPRIGGAGAVVVRFDDNGRAEVSKEDWEQSIQPYATAQAIFKE